MKLNKSNLLISSIVLFLTVSCNDCVKQQSDQNNEKEKALIKQTLTQMWDAIEKEDLERYASFIHPDFTQFGEYDSVLQIGKDQEIAGIAAWVKEASEIHTEMHEPMVTVRGNTAWIVYYWKDRGTTEQGDFSTRGKSTRIFVKENNKWLCIHGHYTLLP